LLLLVLLLNIRDEDKGKADPFVLDMVDDGDEKEFFD
jgi:hypothetical protein